MNLILNGGQLLKDITDAISYNQAIIQTNSSLCENISAQEMKDTCINLVKQKLDFTNGNLKATGKK
jgi:hypothetical protein